MALRNILTRGDDTLLKHSREVTKYDARLHMLIDDMLDTLKDANGAGLAAPQVGVLRRVILVISQDDTGYVELVNPEIVSTEGEQVGPEGCLSVPGLCGIVSRPMKVVVKAFDRNGKRFEMAGEGLCARALCHEIDHLNGVLYTEHVIEYIDLEDELEDADENTEE